mgnify:CR=1 FL=1|tara:strand:+ start:9095 stop:10951 length:1857 start_codon:yes stop_codon:yes gene_type:complete
MCGIAGVVSSEKSDLSGVIKEMCDAIKHRGPDGEGFFIADKFALGHRRLSVIDLSEKGKQPMKYGEMLEITFNGEIYNYIEIRKELLSLGYKFESDTDTEVVLAAYAHWGKNCLTRLNGMFSFALYDKKRNYLFCARDRFGVKPFYYTQINKIFSFASEIKQFSVLDGWKANVNKDKVFDFLKYEGIHDHTNETLFANVFQLMGGECLDYNLLDNKFTISRWYNLNSSSEFEDLAFEDAKVKFKDLFNDAVNLRLRSDVKVGSCLSGGLDSSAIVCVINEELKKTGKEHVQQTVSACFNDESIDERKFIEEVINKTNVISNKVFPTFEEGFSLLDKILWNQDEPFGTTSIYAQWSVYEEAKKKGLTVMLDGQGADEYLAGYGLYQQMHFSEAFDNWKFYKLFKSIRNYREKYNDYYNNPYRNLLSRKFSQYAPYWLKSRLINKSNYSWLKYNNNSKNQKKLPNTIKKLSKKQLLYSSLPKLLHHQDRNSMAHSIESRTPFVDYRLIELVYSLPSDYKVNNGITKFILREAFKGVIPTKILNRYDKLGFATPQARWFEENSEQIRKEIENACDVLDNYINKNEIIKLLDNSSFLRSQNINLFWRIICVSRWVKVFKVSL